MFKPSATGFISVHLSQCAGSTEFFSNIRDFNTWCYGTRETKEVKTNSCWSNVAAIYGQTQRPLALSSYLHRSLSNSRACCTGGAECFGQTLDSHCVLSELFGGNTSLQEKRSESFLESFLTAHNNSTTQYYRPYQCSGIYMWNEYCSCWTFWYNATFWEAKHKHFQWSMGYAAQKLVFILIQNAQDLSRKQPSCLVDSVSSQTSVAHCSIECGLSKWPKWLLVSALASPSTSHVIHKVFTILIIYCTLYMFNVFAYTCILCVQRCPLLAMSSKCIC